MINGKSLLDYIHPIGTYYIADDGEHPAEKFYKLCGYGGTWEKKEGVFLLASSDKYSLGSEGGSADAVVVQHRHTPAMTISDWADGSHWQVTLYNGNYDYVSSYYRIGKTGNATATGMQSATGYAGEDGTGKNMPPYIVVDVYKRVEDPVE